MENNKFSVKKFIFSILFNAVILAIALFVFKPFFEEIDDTQICMIVEGAFGPKDWHVIYPNFLLGKFYVLLQTLAPMVRWHIVLQYVAIYVGYVFSVYVISKHKRGLYISIAAVLATFYELYVSIQYTKTASFICGVGFILLFEYVRNNTSFKNTSDTMISGGRGYSKNENRLFIAIAVLLILYGALLRPESFFIAGVSAAAVGLIELSRTKNIKKYLVVFAPVFAMVLLLSVLNSSVYKKDETWSHFMQYNQARMQLNDYRYDILYYPENGDKLKELSVSENDALAILTYQYGDDTVFSLDRFLEIRAPFPARKFGYKTFANLYENLVNELKRSYTILVGLCGLIVVLIASNITDGSKSAPGFISDARRKWAEVCLLALFCGSAIVYFQYSGRYSHRLIGAIVVPTIFMICYSIDSIFIKDNDSKIVFGGNKNDLTMAAGIVISIVLIGLNGLLYMRNTSDYSAYQAEQLPMLNALNEMTNDKDSLYVGDTFTFQNVWKYQTFNVFEEKSLDNFVTCGSWYLNSPITKSITNKYGYENPMTAIRGGDDNIFLLDNMNTECKTLFLTEHYDKIYKAIMLENRGGIDVYRVQETEK